MCAPRSPLSLSFKVGNKPVRNFRMIERHYFKDKLMQVLARHSTTLWAARVLLRIALNVS